ncbi:hypothetical protein AAC387_Pa02g4635 [Persea americana]
MNVETQGEPLPPTLNSSSVPAMAIQQETSGRNTVPQFGGWDPKTGGSPDYSVVFSRARENRKKHKSEFNRPTLENDEQLATNQSKDSTPARRKILSYLRCFKA